MTVTATLTDSRTLLWKGAGLTAAAAVVFPRFNAVLYDDLKFWELDPEAAVLAPLVVALTLLLFSVVGTAAWRGAGNRPATAGLVCGVMALVGVLAFWLSAPIILGGLATTLGLEGLRRAALGRRGQAVAAVALGLAGVAAGASIWLVGV
jgi:hypothetical protein